MYASSEMETMDRASIQCLVSGYLAVAKTHGKVAYAAPICRSLESGNELQAVLGGAWRIWQWQGLCIPRGVRATTGGAQCQYSPLC